MGRPTEPPGPMGVLLCAAGLLAPPIAATAQEELTGATMLSVAGPELLLTAPDDTTAIFSNCTYSRSTGTELVLSYFYERVSDVADETLYRWSEGNARTWSDPVKVGEQLELTAQPLLTLPSGPYVGGHANPFRPERLVLGTARVLPEGMDPDVPQSYWTQTGLTFALSTDDGRTLAPARPLVKQGAGSTEQHPFDGLYLGRNQVYALHRALFLDADTVLVPAELSVLGEDGALYNPHGWDFAQVVVLIGRRQGDTFGWDSSAPIRLDAFTESTRGLNEPTLGRLADGGIIMVLRGSNSFLPALPSRKWLSVSADEGQTWSYPQPWTYDDGDAFLSPSSISHLVRHSSGRLFWFGNICPENADGNSPRYPLVVGEVDLRAGLLRRDTVTTIADRTPDKSPQIQYSNFSVYEDREAGEFVLDVTHYVPSGKPNRRQTAEAWTGNVYRYRIAVRRGV